MDRPHRLAARATALLVGLMLAGCTGGAAGGPTPAPGGGATPTATTPPTSASPSASATPTSKVTPGSIDQTVEPREQGTAKPVRLDKAQSDGGVEVSLVSIKSRKIEAVGPGEIGGASLVVTVRISNDTKNDLDVDSAYVTLMDSKGRMAVGLTNDPSRPFSESIGVGKSATGVYVFRVPTKARSNITVSVTYSLSHKTAVFVGDAS